MPTQYVTDILLPSKTGRVRCIGPVPLQRERDARGAKGSSRSGPWSEKTITEGTEKATKLLANEMHIALTQQRMEMSAVVSDIRRHTLLMLLASGAVLGAAILLSLF